MPFQHLNKPEFIAIFVWIGYTILEIANPISPGPIAWFYAMRAMSLYFILTPIVVCGFFNSPRDIKNLIYLFAPTAFILAIIAIRQDAFGMNSYEMDWLNSGPIRTHLLRGKMREFSLLADASTFGAYSAYMCLFFGVLAALPLQVLLWAAGSMCFSDIRLFFKEIIMWRDYGPHLILTTPLCSYARQKKPF